MRVCMRVNTKIHQYDSDKELYKIPPKSPPNPPILLFYRQHMSYKAGIENSKPAKARHNPPSDILVLTPTVTMMYLSTAPTRTSLPAHSQFGAGPQST